MNRKLMLPVFFVLFLCASLANAQTTTNVVVTPSSPVFDSNHVVGVPGDAAPGFSFGSFASDGVAKTDMYFTPESLFGRAVTLGEVANMGYWTKKGTTHVADPRDWFINIYTKKYLGQTISFYGARIGTEPYFSENLVDPASTWNQWTTGGPANQLRFFESTYGYFGSYTDLHLAPFVAGNSLAGSHGPSVPYAPQEILFFSAQTATAWAAGFTGQLDGLRIELTDGSVANINFEPFEVATSKDACKNGGWLTLHRANGSTFRNQGDCIQYVNTGK